MKKGFTLIELLVTIGILGVLASALVATINPISQFQKSRDARRKQDLRTIITFLNEYYNDNGGYPPAGSCGPGNGGNGQAGYGNCYVYSSSGTNWIPALVPKYSSTLPQDPIDNTGQGAWVQGYHQYVYGNVTPDGQHYDLFTQLEYKQDPDRCEVKDYIFAYGFPSFGPYHWCKSPFNYSNELFTIIHE